MSKDVTKGWCWGAFFLSWVWGIRCRVWSSFYAFIPGFNIIWAFVLGAKGRKWAWEKGNWRDEEHFNRVQEKWDIAGVAVFVAAILLQVLPYMFTY